MDLVSVFFFKKNVFFKEDLCIIKKTEEDNRYAEVDIEKIYVKYMCRNKYMQQKYKRLTLQERSKGAQVTANVCITDLLRTKEKVRI